MTVAKPAKQLATTNFRIPDGPWNADVWRIPRPARHATSGETECAVSTCDRPAGRAEGDPIRATDVLCIGHRTRFRKTPDVTNIDEFIEQQSAGRPILEPRGRVIRKPHYPAIDFTQAPGTLADELRYVTAMKTTRMNWRDGAHVSYVLRGAINLGAKYRIGSLRDFPLPAADLHRGDECLAAMFPDESGAAARCFAAALRSLLVILDEAHADPWEGDTWRVASFELPGISDLYPVAALHWSRVTCDWLRKGLKSLAREHLKSGSRSWGTIQAYVRGGSLLCRYFDEEIGQIGPSELSRAVFLDFVAWVGDENTKPTDRRAINTLARLLAELRHNDIVPELPGTPFLLRGENAVPITRKPKPFPADILEAIDLLLADDSALPRVER